MLPPAWLNRKPTAMPQKAPQTTACASRRSFGATARSAIRTTANTSAVRKPKRRFQPVMGPASRRLPAAQ